MQLSCRRFNNRRCITLFECSHRDVDIAREIGRRLWSIRGMLFEAAHDKPRDGRRHSGPPVRGRRRCLHHMRGGELRRTVIGEGQFARQHLVRDDA